MIIVRVSGSDYRKNCLHTLQPRDQEYRGRDLQGPKKWMNLRIVRTLYREARVSTCARNKILIKHNIEKKYEKKSSHRKHRSSMPIRRQALRWNILLHG